MSSTPARPNNSGSSNMATSSSVPLTLPVLAPITLHDTPAARAISYARPLAYLALLTLRFRSLVNDPVRELQAGLPVVAGVQVAYAVSCLPIAGAEKSKPTRKSRPGERKKADASCARPNVSAILSVLLAAIVTPAVYVLFILFGAPFLDYTPHTMLLAAHFSILALFPLFYARGVDGQSILSIAGAMAPMDETFGGLAGALLGAWLGAVPIPLDWDRDWQRWPVTIVVGMYIGHCVGSKVVGNLLYGRKFSSITTKQD